MASIGNMMLPPGIAGPLAAPSAPGGFMQRFGHGADSIFGKLGGALFGANPQMTQGMDPAQLKQMQQQAMLQMGLGMLSTARQGFGRSAFAGLGNAQAGFQDQMQQQYQMARQKKQEQDQDADRAKAIEQQTFNNERARLGDIRAQEQDNSQTLHWEQQLKAQEASDKLQRDTQLQVAKIAHSGARLGNLPSGYRPTADGGLEPIPGGPADPRNPKNDRADIKQVQQLRKEFENQQSVKDYKTVLPVMMSARKAPDTPAGDLQVIYAVGKILDPGSVVREGELQLTQNAAPFVQKLVGQARAQLSGQGRLTPDTRAAMNDMLNQAVMSRRQAYDMDYNRFAEIAGTSGYTPRDVVGKHAANAYPHNPDGTAAASWTVNGRLGAPGGSSRSKVVDFNSLGD